MRFTLPIVVFVSGAVVMILELVASRIIAPYLGTSVIVWTSLIGVILAALSLGNWIGGRLADKYPSIQTLAFALLVASMLIGINSHFQTLLAFVSTFANLQVATILGVVTLFGPATIALGTIAPLAVKLSLQNLEKSGSTVGNLYAISNTGSIIGTFLGGFALISLIGSTRILTLLALTLAALALFLFVAGRVKSSIKTWGMFAAVGLTFIPSSNQIVLASGSRLVADVDTLYSRTWVVDQPMDNVTVRTLNNSVIGHQSGMVVEYPDQLLFAYVKAFDFFKLFNPKATNALMIGGSGYTYPKHFVASDTSRRATVVEIDPGVTELAKQYFGLTDDHALEIVHEDGRMFLNRSNRTYDLVVMDAFSSRNSIPFHLTTLEAVQRISEHLAPDGIVMVNIVSALEGQNSGFLAAEYATYKEIFPHVRLFQIANTPPTEYQNILLIASNEPLIASSDTAEAKTFLEQEWLAPLHEYPPLTDDFAPVEKYMGTL